MSEGMPVPLPGGEALQGATTNPTESSAPDGKTRLITPQEIAGLVDDLTKAGEHTLAESLRQAKESDEDIRQRNSQELETRFARENAAWKAEAAAQPPSVSSPEENTQQIDLQGLAEYAGQQGNHSLAAELRKKANPPSAK